jgi:hypothetical protein
MFVSVVSLGLLGALATSCSNSSPKLAKGQAPSANNERSDRASSDNASSDTVHDMAGMDMAASDSVASDSVASDSVPSNTVHDMAAMAGMDGGSESPGMLSTDATVATADGLTLNLRSRTAKAGSAQTLSFSIDDSTGNALLDYQVEQTKKLHLIVVRADLTGYQHLHPTLDTKGIWSIPADLSNAGKWRVIADFTPIKNGKPSARIALGTDVTVEGTGVDSARGKPALSVDTSDGFTATLDSAAGLKPGKESMITFTISKGGKSVTDLVPYLGSFGHLVAIRASDFGYLHVHPMVDATDENAIGGPRVAFNVDVPKAGPHSFFLQFATAAGVHTAPFVINVS